MRFALIALLFAPAAWAKHPALPARDFVPDPASVERCGPGYRYPQAGWIILHIEGDPYERGYQHGKLLAREIEAYIFTLARFRSEKAPEHAWRDLRLMVNALFLRRYDKEYLEEMKGIADGAAAGGAKAFGKAVDLLDVVTINSGIEVDFLHRSLEATPTGLEGKVFHEPPYGRPVHLPPAHCSAFAATGPATRDGKIVFGHITMWALYPSRFFNIWLDVKPTRGHRMIMQSFPGGIMSGLDYYMNDAGILICETTISQTRFEPNAESLVSRIRRTIQYADSIDKAVAILNSSSNGLYSNEWLLADVKTNEIAMFELGTNKSKLWRSSKNEWLGGTEGFYWGCNNTKDLEVRLESIPSVHGKPHNVVFRPSVRDMAWIRLYEKHKGKIDVSFGFEAFTMPPIAAFPSLDAKFTTTDMAKELKSWALFGPPLGQAWTPTDAEKRRWDDISPLVSNDWTVLHGKAPPASPESVAVDLKPRPLHDAGKDEDEADPESATLPPAWHGTILPRSDADVGLAAAFAEYERLAALEKALRARSPDGKLKAADQEKLDLALWAYRSRWHTAAQRHGDDLPPAKVQQSMHTDAPYEIAVSRGVLLLSELRRRVGPSRFDKTLDEFGRANAGKPTDTSELLKRLGVAEQPETTKYLTEKLFDPTCTEASWAVTSFERDSDETLIVYGTLKELHAQREAAELLQQNLRRRFGNYTIPIKSDQEVTAEELRGRHLLLVGRPDSNAVAAKVAEALPLRFGAASFTLKDRLYAHPASGVVAAGSNPANLRYSVVLFAGLSAEATRRIAEVLPNRGGILAPVFLWQAGEKVKPVLAENRAE